MANSRVKKMAASTSVCALAGLMMLGGAQILAYMTDVETATNTFTVGNVKVELEEPSYPGNGSDEVKELVPNEPVDKDPQAENTGENTEAIFMSYDIPMADVQIVGKDGRLFTDGTNYYVDATKQGDSWMAEAGVAEMLGGTGSAAQIVQSNVAVTEVLPADRVSAHYEVFGAMYNGKSGVNDADWTLIKTVYIDAAGNEIGDVEDADADVLAAAAGVRRIYSYNTLLGKDGKTNPLFDQVYLKNVVEGSIDSSIQEITAKVYAIQAAHLKAADGSLIVDFDDDSDVDPSTVNIDKATAEKIYDIYVGQNGENPADNNADNSNAKDQDGNTRNDAEMYLKVDMHVDDTRLNVSEKAVATAAVDTNYDSVTYAFTAHDSADGSDTDGSEVISVDAATGVIEALKPGVAYVKVTATKAADAGLVADKTATAIVKVVVENELKISLTGDDAVMVKDGTKQLTPEVSFVQPTGATIRYTYKSSNTAVATVDNSGLVTAHNSGSAVITCTAEIDTQDGTGTKTATASFDVSVQN